MKHYILIIILSLCFVSCNKHSVHWKTITSIEAIIEERPDSVLNVLQAINADELVGDEEQAKHALLFSMAMDKNYIDRTDFEVLQPAIDYYEDNGTSTDKLRTLYYQGRIYHNIGNEAEAMTSYLKALDKGQISDDILTKARIYVAQGNIYSSLLKWDKANEVNLSAAKYFLKENRVDSYVNCLLKVINGHMQIDHYDEIDKLLTECRNYLNSISTRCLGKYYSGCLTFLYATRDNESIPSIINEYLAKVPDENIDDISIANAYLSCGDAEKALDAISNIRITQNIQQELRYYSTLSAIYEQRHELEKAMASYEKYYELHDSVVYSVFKQETQFIEQKHNLQMQIAKETESKNNRTIIILICIIVLFALLAIINLIHRRLKDSNLANVQLEKEKQQYESMYRDVLSERDALTKMIEDSSVKDEAKAVIKERLDVLNKVIISQITGTSAANKKAVEELKALLTDKDTFIESTRLTIEGNNPEFISTLKKQGLTDKEINICCLYAIGLKGKDIKAYTSQPRHYNQSADIRHKLGLTENDTNLSIFLRNMLEK